MLPALETGRLTLRPFGLGDAGFVLGLLNEPSFLLHIGDKGVRTEDDARRYIAEGPLASYARSGYGLYVVELHLPSAYRMTTRTAMHWTHERGLP